METKMEAKQFLTESFKNQGDYEFLPEGVLNDMIEALMQADADFMERTGVDDGGLYDDELAEKELFEAMSQKFPDYKMYMMRLVNDYLDYNEEYLLSVDGIEWE